MEFCDFQGDKRCNLTEQKQLSELFVSSGSCVVSKNCFLFEYNGTCESTINTGYFEIGL